MKKRFLSLLCVLALCLGLLPVTALAAAEGAPDSLYVGNQQVSSGNDITYWTTDKSTGRLTKYEGNDDNWNVKYDPSTAILTLSGATIQGADNTGSAPYGAGIYAQGSNGQPFALTIELIGTNTITGTLGIYVNAQISTSSIGTDASLVIKNSGDNGDNGSLTVTGTASYGLHITSGTGNASLTIKNVSVVANATSSYSGSGVCVQSGASATDTPNISLSVDGGSLTASGGTSEAGIQFHVGNSSASATTSLTVSGNAIVDARTGGIEAYQLSTLINTNINATGTSGGIVFDGTGGTVYGTVELQEDLEIGAGESLTVGDGASLNANGKLTNNGTINVENGGTVTGNLSGGTAVTTPSISGQPQNKEVTEGETAEFSVTATAGNETPTYQWQQSTDSGSNWTDISDATANSYTINSTTTSMSGNQYRCVVKSASGVGVISNAATLTVQAKPASVPVTGVSLDKATLELFTGGSATLTATVEPDNATNKNVTWQSNNTNVATVEGGTVTAVGAGETDITVTTEEGSYTATCKVTVTRRSSGSSGGSSTPTKTPSQQTINKIESAKDGSTVEIKLSSGSTKLDKEVFEELAGKDVTLEISVPGGITWTVNGQDIPKNAKLSDLDLGVTLDASTIPVSVINTITGTVDTIQLSLKHDGAFGFTMTLTAPLGKTNAGYWANLYYYDEGSRALEFQAADKIASDGTAEFPFDHASQYAIVIDTDSHEPVELPFTDVPEDYWAYSEIAWAWENGYMSGTAATTFHPGGTVTRQQVWMILARMAGAKPSDMAEAKAWAVANGISDGTNPGAPVTRQQFAAMLYRYAVQSGMAAVTLEENLSFYPDAADVSSYAVQAMNWAVGRGIIGGTTAGTLNPSGPSTRAQTAVMLQRFCAANEIW